eukprot:9415051-Pyramimonas_sp.AAC.1
MANRSIFPSPRGMLDLLLGGHRGAESLALLLQLVGEELPEERVSRSSQSLLHQRDLILHFAALAPVGVRLGCSSHDAELQGLRGLVTPLGLRLVRLHLPPAAAAPVVLQEDM